VIFCESDQAEENGCKWVVWTEAQAVHQWIEGLGESAYEKACFAERKIPMCKVRIEINRSSSRTERPLVPMKHEVYDRHCVVSCSVELVERHGALRGGTTSRQIAIYVIAVTEPAPRGQDACEDRMRARKRRIELNRPP
jgi:hypothetical protein